MRPSITDRKKRNWRARNRRADFTHKLSRSLVDRYDIIAIEKLQIRNMQKNGHLSKSIADASWNQLFRHITEKAESAGRIDVAVNPADTSQRCSTCGETVRKSLSVRVHNCSHCGLVLDRDTNAAINILSVGLHTLDLSPGSSPIYGGE